MDTSTRSHLPLVVALEAFEAGDVAYAADVLLGALEDVPRVIRARCACGAEFAWPGLVDAHVDSGACPLTRSRAA